MKGMVVVLAFALVGFGSCDPSAGSAVVGSGNDTQITGTSFTVDTTYMDASGSGQLVARGLVKASVKIGPPWYVEAQFYSDSTLSTKLGGANSRMDVSLSPGQSTYWTIRFYTSTVDIRQFPDFGVGDLRAIYKN